MIKHFSIGVDLTDKRDEAIYTISVKNGKLDPRELIYDLTETGYVLHFSGSLADALTALIEQERSYALRKGERQK